MSRNITRGDGTSGERTSSVNYLASEQQHAQPTSLVSSARLLLLYLVEVGLAILRDILCYSILGHVMHIYSYV